MRNPSNAATATMRVRLETIRNSFVRIEVMVEVCRQNWLLSGFFAVEQNEQNFCKREIA
jgi:hypothetical protein